MLFIFMSMLTLLVALSLARQCAQLWLKTRESLEYPLGVVSEPVNLVCPTELLEAAVRRVSPYRSYLAFIKLFVVRLQY